MKRKISMLLVGMLIVGLLGGCGSSKTMVKDGQSDDGVNIEQEEEYSTLTVSELLNTIIEEKGQVDIYTMTGPASKDHLLDKNDQVYVYSYDGKTIKNYADFENRKTKFKLGEIVQGTAEIPDGRDDFLVDYYLTHAEGKVESIEANLAITTDATGNNTAAEALYAKVTGTGVFTEGMIDEDGEEERVGEVLDFEQIGGYIYFSSSINRCQIYDQSFLVFKTTKGDGTNARSIEYTIIPDTESTIEKDVVVDSVGTEGIEIDTLESLNGFYAY